MTRAIRYSITSSTCAGRSGASRVLSTAVLGAVIAISSIALPQVAHAQQATDAITEADAPAPSMAPSLAPSQADRLRQFGTDGFEIPPALENNQTSPRTVQLLIEALKKAQGQQQNTQRLLLIADLGSTHLPAAADAVVLAMDDPYAPARAQAIASAAILKAPGAKPRLATLFQDADPIVRRQVVASAQVLTDASEAQSILIKALGDPSPLVQAKALEVANNSAEAQAIAASMSNLPAELQPVALAALGRINDPQTVDAVVAMVKADLPQRVAAIEALGNMAASSQVTLIQSSLSDSNPTVRRAALVALAKAAPAQASQLSSRSMLNDADPDVQAAAARLCGPADNQELLQTLLTLLTSDHRPLHDAARDALGRATPAMQPKVILLANSLFGLTGMTRPKEDAAWLFGHYRNTDSVEKLIQFLSDGLSQDDLDRHLAAQIVLSLGEIGDKRACDILANMASGAVEAIASQQAHPASAALPESLRALGMLHDPRAVTIGASMLSIKPSASPGTPRTAAVYAMGMAGKPDDTGLINQLQSILTGTTESPETRFEAGKALANLQAQSSIDFLKNNEQKIVDPMARYGAHLALETLTGQSLPYTPPSAAYIANTSIVDVPEK